jgi:hypothetical protein
MSNNPPQEDVAYYRLPVPGAVPVPCSAQVTQPPAFWVHNCRIRLFSKATLVKSGDKKALRLRIIVYPYQIVYFPKSFNLSNVPNPIFAIQAVRS